MYRLKIITFEDEEIEKFAETFEEAREIAFAKLANIVGYKDELFMYSNVKSISVRKIKPNKKELKTNSPAKAIIRHFSENYDDLH